MSIVTGILFGNPKAAQMRRSFFYDFSNYGTYDQLTVDGLTQWHPAFLELGKTLDKCATNSILQLFDAC